MCLHLKTTWKSMIQITTGSTIICLQIIYMYKTHKHAANHKDDAANQISNHSHEELLRFLY